MTIGMLHQIIICSFNPQPLTKPETLKPLNPLPSLGNANTILGVPYFNYAILSPQTLILIIKAQTS